LLKISTNKTLPRKRSADSVKTLLNPENILLIGASAGRTNMGRIVLNNLSESKIIPKEKIFLLHPDPQVSEIEGFKTYNSLDEISGKIDLTVFTIPASDNSIELIEKLIDNSKTESLIIISGGFEETEKGKGYSERIKSSLEKKRKSSSHPTVINGPNCMGIASGPGGYNTFFIPKYKLSFDGKLGGESAFISQSGAFLVSMMSVLNDVNPAYMITVGNQLDLTIPDYLLSLGDNSKLDIFFLYIEGFKPFDGKRFLDAAGKITQSGKKIVVYKSGRNPEGAAAVASHTAAMAGDYFIFRRLMNDAGILVADSIADFEDYMKIFSFLSGKSPGGRRVGIISDAGYECSSASDNLGGLRLAKLKGKTISKLKGNLPSGIVDIKNPVDTTPAVDTANFGKCAQYLIDDPGTDCILISNVAATFTQENLEKGDGHNEDIRNKSSHPNTIIGLVESTDKPVAVSLNGGKIYDPAARMMEKAGVCVFRKIDRAIKALDKFVSYS
ncbi:MAG TPA: CoA-binding protein, partial [Candidatus Krumholzibacteriaceae bacterium]|nr:CoA-binding protein [Candidatus Krumholzibacteriaceae bacterium]